MTTWRKLSLAAGAFIAALLQTGCTGLPEGVEAITDFDLDRYLGTWYEIARLDHRFERDMSHVTANYSLRDDGGVKVTNRGYDTSKGKWNEATGKAYFVGEPDVGRLKVSFFGPFYGGYNILELDKDKYEYVLVAGPGRNYLWILARSPDPDPAVVASLVDKAASLNFPTDELIFVDHTTRVDQQ